MKLNTLAVTAVLTLSSTFGYAANTALDKGPSDEMEFHTGGTVSASLTTTGDFSVTGKIIADTPTATNHVATKDYVDTAVAGASGGGSSGAIHTFKQQGSTPSCPSGWTSLETGYWMVGFSNASSGAYTTQPFCAPNRNYSYYYQNGYNTLGGDPNLIFASISTANNSAGDMYCRICIKD